MRSLWAVAVCGFRWNVDPALILVACYLRGNNVAGGRVAGFVKAVGSTGVVKAGGANEQE